MTVDGIVVHLDGRTFMEMESFLLAHKDETARRFLDPNLVPQNETVLLSDDSRGI